MNVTVTIYAIYYYEFWVLFKNQVETTLKLMDKIISEALEKKFNLTNKRPAKKKRLNATIKLRKS